MGQYVMTCPECDRPRDFTDSLPVDHCLYCGYSYKDETHQLTVEQEASIRLAPYFRKVRPLRRQTQ